MAQKRECTWFIESRNLLTNEVLARELSDENFNRDVMCSDGIARNLWECTHRLITYLRKSRFAVPLDFYVFNRMGEHGPVRRSTITEKRRLRFSPREKELVLSRRVKG